MSETKTIAPKAAYPNPFLWVPTSYLAMGLIYSTLANVANIMFKNMGLDNAQAAFWSSLFVLPYVIKPLWAPTVELYKTKKFFVIGAQCALVIVVACVALALRLPSQSFVLPAIGLFIIIGLVGATQDIASDGVYVTTLGPAEQAKYIGIQSLCWNGGPVIANGVLVHVSGAFYKSTGNWGQAWMMVMFMVAGLIGLLALYHTKLLPPGAKALDAPKSFGDAAHTFGHAFATFFQKKNILLMIAFAFFFRFGYGFLDKMIPLFMIDARAKGGLGLTNESLGDIYGTFGALAFMAGSILGGLFVAKRGLRRTLFLLCLCMNVPNAVFILLSQSQTQSYPVIASLVTVEKFFWGFGAVGQMIYMMHQIAPGPYKTAHYTFATAFMGFNMMFTGMISGKVEELVGYKTFFILALVAASIPSVLATLFAPFHHPDSAGPNAAKLPEKTEAAAAA
jgi:PAT family beta-lactamase induction signal transducer AmpG